MCPREDQRGGPACGRRDRMTRTPLRTPASFARARGRELNTTPSAPRPLVSTTVSAPPPFVALNPWHDARLTWLFRGRPGWPHISCSKHSYVGGRAICGAARAQPGETPPPRCARFRELRDEGQIIEPTAPGRQLQRNDSSSNAVSAAQTPTVAVPCVCGILCAHTSGGAGAEYYEILAHGFFAAVRRVNCRTTRRGYARPRWNASAIVGGRAVRSSDRFYGGCLLWGGVGGGRAGGGMTVRGCGRDPYDL